MESNDDFWNTSNISNSSKHFFDNNVGICFAKEERSFEPEIETLENYVEVSANRPNLNIPVNSQTYSINDYSSTFADQHLSKNPQTVFAKKEAEIDFLKRQLTETVAPSTTVLRIIMAQAYSVDCYKSREQKVALLDEALKRHDGDAILVAVRLLERSLKPSLFHFEMASRPVAIDHYTAFLVSQPMNHSKAIDALSMFNRSNQAAMLRLQQALKCHDTASKVASLKKCLDCHFRCDHSLQTEASFLQAHINLLELQVPIQENDDRTRNDNEVMRTFPPPSPLPNTSALSTLYYTCLYHYHDSPTLLTSPHMIKKNQGLSDKQFLWKAMGALIRLKKWSELEELFVTKNWIGGRKLRSPIEFARVVTYLHQMSAPLEIKMKYCELIDDPARRIEVAADTGCHKVVLKSYKDMKDRRGIEEYSLTLNQNSTEGFLAQEILNDLSIKWRK